jgi:teichuronic acid biosynthesis glycosyltransferase TuaC
MKVLFICSGKSGKVGEVVKNQGDSLKAVDLDISYCLLKPGIIGYLKSIPIISRTFKQGNFELAHAHYSFSGFAAALANCKPLVVSLMGSDLLSSGWQRFVCKVFSLLLWDRTIVKSEQMKALLDRPAVKVIPNGVDLERFKPIAKSEARQVLNISSDKRIILFIGGKDRIEKNFALAEAAIGTLNNSNLVLLTICNIPHHLVPYYLNASDVLLLTSNWEGSANSVKEAMACGCPVVATRVGDVEWLLGNCPGHYISGFSTEEVAGEIASALEYSGKHGRTQGRARIFELELDSFSIAKKIAEVYKSVK